MQNILHHWYDGKIYDLFIAKNQLKYFSRVKQFIKKDSKILDAGCGTALLALVLKELNVNYTGIELSEKNFLIVSQNLAKHKIDGIIYLADVSDYLNSRDKFFDYAFISFVLHEIDEEKILQIPQFIAKYSSYQILIDYSSNQENTFYKFINLNVKLIAGKNHYKNFNNFINNHGLKKLINELGLTIIQHIKFEKYNTEIFITTNSN